MLLQLSLSAVKKAYFKGCQFSCFEFTTIHVPSRHVKHLSNGRQSLLILKQRQAEVPVHHQGACHSGVKSRNKCVRLLSSYVSARSVLRYWPISTLCFSYIINTIFSPISP